MWIVLCESNDASAHWAYEGLRDRGLAPIELVTADMLAQARWVHCIGQAGAKVAIDLPDGRKLRSDKIQGTVNRLMVLPQEFLLLVDPADRQYVIQEMTAFFIGWINTLPGQTINPATPQCLSGPVRHISEWISLAGRAGLPVPVYRQSSRAPSPPYAAHARVSGTPSQLTTVLVIGPHVIGAAPPAHITDGCRRLTLLSKTILLGIEFVIKARDMWEFAGINTFPDLRTGGSAFLDSLAANLQYGWGGGA
jgi:hypothetical protein